MARFLILYGTTDGHTAKVARFLAGELRSLGAMVDIFQAAKSAPSPLDYTGAIVAASLHGDRYQRDLVLWARDHAATLRHTPSAFLSVCLAVLQHDPKVERELAAIKERFVAQTGWEPPQFKSVAGALLYTRYGWLKRLVMRRVSRKTGGDTDVSRDYEYTDWADLRTFAAAFCARCGRSPAFQPKAAELAGATRGSAG